MGDLFGQLFGENYLQKNYVNDELQKQIDESARAMPSWYRDIAKKSAEQLIAANPELVKQQRSAADLALANINKATTRAAGFDPTASAKDWSTFQMGQLQKLINAATGSDTAASKMARARLGYAGRPASAYENTLRRSDFYNLFGPMAGQMIGGAGDQAIRFGQANNSAIAPLLQAAGFLPGMFESTADAYLRPARAAYSTAGGDVDLLTGYGNAAKTNFAGFEQKRKHGFGDYFSAATSLLTDNVGKLTDAAGGVMGILGGGGAGGGLMGMLGGGMGGGGGGKNRNNYQTDTGGGSFSWATGGNPGGMAGLGGDRWY